MIATSSAGVAESRSGPRKRAVRWKEPSLLRMTPFSTSAAQGRKSARLWRAAAIFGEVHHRANLTRPDAAGSAGAGAPRRRRRDRAWRPRRRRRWPISQISAADDPEAQAEADRGGERAVDDRDRARRAAEQDRFGQRAMDGRVEAGDGRIVLHQTSAPPPNWKKVRKKLDAAKAIDRPKTIWISRRKPPRGLAEGERQAGDDDDDHRDDLGDRPLDRLQDLVERLLPRHVGAGGVGRRGQRARRTAKADSRGERTASTRSQQHHGSPAGVRT